MNKKLLMKQNSQLFDKLHQSEAVNRRLKQQIAALRENIAKLEKELEELKNQPETEISAEPIEREEAAPEAAEETVAEQAAVDEIKLSDEIEYGSAAIGEIVIQATMSSNKLKELGKPNIKELLNLILGRTEVSKGEILSIISSDASFDAKKQMIDSLKKEVFEYFVSVLEQ